MDYLLKIVQAYRNRGLLLDTNLLLLLLVGRCEIGAVQRFKRTKIFTAADFYLLRGFVDYFAKIVTTPNILTEVSNFLNQLPEHNKNEHFEEFSKAIQRFDERYHPSSHLAGMSSFIKFGLTDSSILAEAKGKYLVLTDDIRLSNYLQKLQIDVINFNHVRVYNWSLSKHQK